MRLARLSVGLLLCLAIAPAANAQDAELGCETRIEALRTMLDEGAVPSPQADTIRSILISAETFCGSDMASMADQQLSMAEELIAAITGTDIGEEEEEDASSMTRQEAGFTDEFLAGEWCYRHPAGESGLYVFHEDGTYQVGPAEMDYELIHDGDTDRLFERYDGIATVEDDAFTVNFHQVVLDFTRGPCEAGAK
jgi:hypothetical protein